MKKIQLSSLLTLKKRTKKIFLCCTSFSLLFISACKKDQIEKLEDSSSTNQVNSQIILGKRVDNPYSVENMKKAYQALSRNAKLENEDSPVRTTHLYVRFLPKDWAQYDTLIADTSLELYNIPLDYEIVSQGSNYHDPSISSDLPTWQYTTVPVDYKFNPQIKYEVITEAYIPELDPQLNTRNTNQRNTFQGKSFKDALLDQAFIITKNYDDTLKNYKGAKMSWTPSGTIKVYDSKLGDIPLEGVKIRVRRWIFVKVREATTNANGYYQTESFDRPVNYSLIWETNHFDVRTGTFGQAMFDGRKQSSPWNITFSVDDANRFYCHVFRGAYRYHYKDIGGLKRPHFGFKLKYAAYDKASSEGDQGVNVGNWSYFALNPNIFIYRFGQYGQFDSDEIFSTTIHETCHSTHASLMNASYVQYLQVDETIAESWPVAVEWFITSMEYRERGISNYGKENYYNVTKRGYYASYPLHRGYQYWTKSIDPKYSSIFIDLVDNFNQNNETYQDSKGFNYLGIKDQVSGYTLSNIESVFLKYCYGISSLKEQCKKNKPSGITDSQLDELLSNF